MLKNKVAVSDYTCKLTDFWTECCLNGELGAVITFNLSSQQPENFRWDELLFGEGGARIIVSVVPSQQEAWETYLRENLNGAWQKLGAVASKEKGLQISTADHQSIVQVNHNSMSDRYYNAIG